MGSVCQLLARRRSGMRVFPLLPLFAACNAATANQEENLKPESKQLGLAPGAAYGIPGFGKVTPYSKTPLGGHYTYINQGPGFSHKKYSGYGSHPSGHKQVEVNEVHRPGFHGGYKAQVLRPRPLLLHAAFNPLLALRLGQLRLQQQLAGSLYGGLGGLGVGLGGGLGGVSLGGHYGGGLFSGGHLGGLASNTGGLGGLGGHYGG